MTNYVQYESVHFRNFVKKFLEKQNLNKTMIFKIITTDQTLLL